MALSGTDNDVRALTGSSWPASCPSRRRCCCRRRDEPATPSHVIVVLGVPVSVKKL